MVRKAEIKCKTRMKERKGIKVRDEEKRDWCRNRTVIKLYNVEDKRERKGGREEKREREQKKEKIRNDPLKK